MPKIKSSNIDTSANLVLSSVLTVSNNATFSGSVGIGTTSPNAKLDVFSSSSNIILSRSSTGYAAFQRKAPAGQQTYDFYTINDVEVARITGDGNDALWFSTGSAATERMRINNVGNVGIGTNAPSDTLTVVGGTSSWQINAKYEGTTQYQGAYIGLTTTAASTNYGQTVLAHSYNVGSGDLTDTSFSIQQRTVGSSYVNPMATFSHKNQYWDFFTSGSQRVRIGSNGSVGIGGTGADASLHIQQAYGGYGRLTQMSSAGTSTDALNIMSSKNGSGGDQWWSWGVLASNYWRICPGVGLGGSAPFSIRSDGRVLIGSATAFDNTVGADLLVTGVTGSCAGFYMNATAATMISFYNSFQTARVGWIGTSNASTSYNTSSDYRLKTNVESLTGALDRVLALNPVRFNWIGLEDSPKVDGFIAHEAATVVPEAVSGEKDEVTESGDPVYQGIDQSKLVPLLVAAIKELAAEVAALKGQK